VIAGLLLGAGLGAGVFMVARALFAGPVPLPVALARLDRPRRASGALSGDPPETWVTELGRRALRVLESLGMDPGRVRCELRVVGRPPERHAVDKLVGALAGAGTPLLVGIVATAGGASFPAGMLAAASLCFGVMGFVLPDMLLRQAAAARRDSFRHALSAYLDLVNVLLAGSAGIETALEAAARAGDGWAFGELRRMLDRARVVRETPADASARLGSELGVVELEELAASLRLAGEQGARIKLSLAAKAASLRGRQLARAEAAAHAASERMAIPNVAMFLGFLAFVGYPALVSIARGT
jgi:hypothetical protein